MSASIGSCNVSSEYCDLFQSPSVKNITNIEYNIEGIISPDHVQEIISAVFSTEDKRPSGIKPTNIYKLWIILENLAEDVAERNKKLTRNKSDNVCLETS